MRARFQTHRIALMYGRMLTTWGYFHTITPIPGLKGYEVFVGARITWL